MNGRKSWILAALLLGLVGSFAACSSPTETESPPPQVYLPVIIGENVHVVAQESLELAGIIYKSSLNI